MSRIGIKKELKSPPSLVVTTQSLVLFHKIGDWTNPFEGAAFVRAILRSLCASMQLTLATTHCAELCTLKGQDSEYFLFCSLF